MEAVVYRHADEGWGKPDWGIVAYEEDRVRHKEFFSSIFSNRPTPPGADTAAGTVGQASYVFLQWKEGLAVMIWHDSSASSSGSGSASDPTYRYQGYTESPGGQLFGWEVQTADGKTALLKIDEIGYDLADGGLFIVTVEAGETRVKQLDRDLSSVQTNWESIAAFAQNVSDVADFAGDVSKP